MQYSTIPAPLTVRSHGLPYGVTQLEPRLIVAAFADEAEAIAYAKARNGLPPASEPEPEPEPAPVPQRIFDPKTGGFV